MTRYMNEASWDRALRVVAGLALLYLGWTGVVGGTLGWILKVGGFLPLVTGVIGWCAVYELFGVSTCATPRAPGAA
ncbi:MAG TPA: DUF2892 domain-containing protein [Gemmatimonadales bacterium]|nr:DUF2892 domain-containing protein [Gemmatimonadales bacterium]